MLYKSEQIREEWEIVRSQKNSRLLLPMALLVDDVSLQVAEVEAVMTHIVRADEEQKRLNALLGFRIGRRSVHQYWRGIDFRSWIYTPEQITEICDRVNSTFEYLSGSGRKLKALAYHQRGTGTHLHLQAPAGVIWRRVRGFE